MGILSHTDESIAFRSLSFIAQSGYPAVGLFHCEEIDVFYVLAERLQKAGRNDLKAWAEARPSWIETMRIIHALELAKGAGAPIYIVHMSCAEAADIVAEARRNGYRIWGETAPHYLTHTAEMEELGCWGKVNTSLKYQRDNERLWRGILDNSVTNIGTDHGAETRQTKEEALGGKGKYDNIWQAVPGICGGMEHLLPVMMTYGVNAGRISIEDMVRVCSSNNARVFGLPDKGVIAPGYDADIILIDPDKEVTIDEDFYHCLGEWSIYLGWKVKGMVRTTILRGEIMLEDYQTVGKPGYGRFIPSRAH
jgi:dihydropyrimidinase/dihydroorotase